MQLVQRTANGAFVIGDDHLATALTFEKRLTRWAPFSAQVASYWSLGEQIGATGPTHLDRVLAGEQIGATGPTHLDRVLAGEAASATGEGRIALKFEQSLQQRRLFLIEQGWMAPHETALTQQGLRRLAQLELTTQARSLSADLEMPVLTYNAHRVAGTYARRIDLAQGRVALIIGERQAVLVPWRPALERFAGREVEGVTRGQGLSWTLSQRLGIALPPM
jgi:hypothetical protein